MPPELIAVELMSCGRTDAAVIDALAGRLPRYGLDPGRSARFWVRVLGAELYRAYGGTSVVPRFAGTWLLLVSGGGPTADKPAVSFAPPADPDLVSHAITIRVADCRASYRELAARGAAFLTGPHERGGEIRCFLRDPDGHLLEISQLAG